MLVRERMSRRVITIDPGRPPGEAEALLARHRIRQLPVLRDGQVVGIVTHRDLRGARRRQRTVAEVMTAKPVVIGPDAAVDEAARVLRTYKVGALPVVDGRALVGIITIADVLDAFVALSGVREATVRLDLVARSGRDLEARARAAVERAHGQVCWLHRDARARPPRLHVRVRARNVEDLVTALEADGFEVAGVVSAPTRALRAPR
ncbi:MAG: CBS domain-containing protein [Deltaproteobacteria bacterium]|nr:CBS domain-containing protein [Deltaproteobacteria bacterium]